MAVYTKISVVEISSHLSNYSIGEVVSLREILDGIDNSNFILTTTCGKFIFTIFESRIDKDSLPFFINLKLHLAQKGIACPRPIISNSGETILDFFGKKSVIVSFLSGSALASDENGYCSAISESICFEVGQFLAKLHLAASDFTMTRVNDLAVTGFAPLFSKFSHLVEAYSQGLTAEITQTISWLLKSWRVDLPSAPAHLDLFPDNVFFSESLELLAAIDFYFAANELLIYDFAIAVNAWCFEQKAEESAAFNVGSDQSKNLPVFCNQKFMMLLSGYESVRQFSSDEKRFLRVALIAAATRFLLTRLHDFFFTPKGSLVKVKDPMEYLHKLQFFSKTAKLL